MQATLDAVSLKSKGPVMKIKKNYSKIMLPYSLFQGS